MSKQKTTMKSIKNNWKNLYNCGYCDLQHIMRYTEADYYNSGTYGWNCDIYVDYKRDIAISSGYRGMVGIKISDEIIQKYSDIAKNIMENVFEKTYEEIKKELDKNIDNFFNELIKL